MLDTILVSAIVLVAAIYVGRRIYRQFTSGESSCGCSGCSGASTCPSANRGIDCSPCDGK